jgi:ubiquinone/menaquinone biosynthesis C-methylase UbiE
MSTPSPDEVRDRMAQMWDRAAPAWGKRAEAVLAMGMPVSTWMIEQLRLQPGDRLLELAAGPGDTGFLASELISPGGTLITSDGSEAMLEVARTRAEALGIRNVEFRQLSLEWIDLPTAEVDKVLCRWGIMLTVDPAAALLETRRVLRPGGRLAMAVWDAPEENPWATIPTRALIELGHIDPPDRNGPGMFALAVPGRLEEMLEDAGFVDPIVEGVAIERNYPDTDSYLRETSELSPMFSDAVGALDEASWTEVNARITELLAPYTAAGGELRLPGRSLAAIANA